MAHNLLRVYNQLLEIFHLNEGERTASLMGVFNRDFANNLNLTFETKRVNPTPGTEPELSILFRHLTTHIIDQSTKKREFEPQRSIRLHWVCHHLSWHKEIEDLKIFSVDDKEGIRTYIYNEKEQYVIILEPYRNGEEYYLLTAYYVEKRNVEKIKKKIKRRLPLLY